MLFHPFGPHHRLIRNVSEQIKSFRRSKSFFLSHKYKRKSFGVKYHWNYFSRNFSPRFFFAFPVKLSLEKREKFSSVYFHALKAFRTIIIVEEILLIFVISRAFAFFPKRSIFSIQRNQHFHRFQTQPAIARLVRLYTQGSLKGNLEINSFHNSLWKRSSESSAMGYYLWLL